MERWLFVGGILMIAIVLLAVGCVGNGHQNSEGECPDGVCPEQEVLPVDDPTGFPDRTIPLSPQSPADVTQLELVPLAVPREPQDAPEDAEPPDAL